MVFTILIEGRPRAALVRRKIVKDLHLLGFFCAHFSAIMVVLTLSLSASPTEAAPVAFEFAKLIGEMPRSQSPRAVSSIGINAGLIPNAAASAYALSTMLIPMNALDANVVHDLPINVGAYMASVAERTGIITLRRIHLPKVDKYTSGESWTIGSSVNDHNVQRFSPQLNELMENIFADSRFATPPSVASFAQMRLRLVLNTDGMVGQRTLTSLSVIPLPTALWLFSVGMIALMVLGARGWMPPKETQAL